MFAICLHICQHLLEDSLTFAWDWLLHTVCFEAEYFYLQNGLRCLFDYSGLQRRAPLSLSLDKEKKALDLLYHNPMRKSWTTRNANWCGHFVDEYFPNWSLILFIFYFFNFSVLMKPSWSYSLWNQRSCRKL